MKIIMKSNEEKVLLQLLDLAKTEEQVKFLSSTGQDVVNLMKEITQLRTELRAFKDAYEIAIRVAIKTVKS